MKIYLDTIGCRLNQSEIETMARQFRAAGHEIVATAEQADMAVVNTCAVTNDAASVEICRADDVCIVGIHIRDGGMGLANGRVDRKLFTRPGVCALATLERDG